MLKSKQFLSVLVIMAIIFSLFVPSISSVSAKNKNFYANKTKITIQKSGSITIVSKKGGALTYKIAKSSICSAKWGKWKGNKIKLKLKGKSYGKTTITVKNKKTKAKLKIKVTVKTVDIKLPQTPFYIRNYDWDGYLTDTVKITKVWTKISYSGYGYDSDPSIKLYVRGTKTYSNEGAWVSSMVYVPWKVYKGSIVKDSDQILTSSIAVGDGFENYDYVDLSPGKYKIKFLDSQG